MIIFLKIDVKILEERRVKLIIRQKGSLEDFLAG